MDDMQTPGPFAPLPYGGDRAGRRVRDEWEPRLPAPSEPPEAGQIFHRKHGAAAMRWVYRNVDGEPLFAVVRFNLPNGDKETLPYTYGRLARTDKAGKHNERTGWNFRRPAVPVPLYGLDRLAARPDAPVLVVEGEKAADAASAIFPDHVCVTSQGGAKAAGKADWAPLAGRTVVLWPDHDEPGASYARDAARLALAIGATSAAIVAVPPAWPSGWDLADALPDSVVADDLAEMLAGTPTLTAEDIDPLAGLVERAMIDRGAPFAPDVIAALVQLQKSDFHQYETLRSELKDAKVRVTQIDKKVKYAARAAGVSLGDERDHEETCADILLRLAADLDFFATPDGTAYADIAADGGHGEHRETWPIRSSGFRRWLTGQYYRATSGGAPASEALASALNAIEAKAMHDGDEREIFVRVGEHDGKLYLDLGDPLWRAVEIDADGWRILTEDIPVRFHRSREMRPIPDPLPGGSITALRPFLNVRDDAEFTLVVAYVLAALRPKGPYPILVVTGEHGSAKTSFSKTVRALIDPRVPPLRSLPRDDRTLFINAGNSHVLGYDNVSSLHDWLSDLFCSIATGAGFAARALYTNNEEHIIAAAKPLMLNGITQFATRPDFADRAIMLNLPTIPPYKRKTEAEFDNMLTAAMPSIMGALLDLVSLGLRRLPATILASMPRMADFARWAVACETDAWAPDGFMAAYGRAVEQATASVLEADSVAVSVVALMAGRKTPWTGSASSLLSELGSKAADTVARERHWPKDPHALSGRLRRAAPPLRAIGINIVFHDSARPKTIGITAVAQPSEPGAAGEQSPGCNTEI